MLCKAGLGLGPGALEAVFWPGLCPFVILRAFFWKQGYVRETALLSWLPTSLWGIMGGGGTGREEMRTLSSGISYFTSQERRMDC